MKRHIIKKILQLTIFCLGGFLLSGYIYADDLGNPNLSEEEIQQANEATEDIANSPGEVNEKIISRSDKLSFRQQVFSGIMNRDTIMNYLVFVIQFLSQLGLIIGTGFIILAGYKYMISLGNSTQTSNQTIKNAIIGIIIIIFSYAIMKTLTSLVGLS